MATILLVDGDAAFRNLVAPELEARGHTVLEAACACEAEALFASFPVHLIVVDGLLPDRDGIAFLEGIRSRCDVPALFVSAVWKEEDRLSRLADVGFVRKPVDPIALTARIERALPTPGNHPYMTPEIADGLAVLRETFVAELPARMEELRTALRRLRREGSANAALQAAAGRQAHNLAGVAGAFGFTAVGDACAELDREMRAHELGPRAWQAVDASLRVLG